MIALGSDVVIISIEDAKRIRDYLFKERSVGDLLDLQIAEMLGVANELDEAIEQHNERKAP
jgi:hypothetical protein